MSDNWSILIDNGLPEAQFAERLGAALGVAFTGDEAANDDVEFVFELNDIFPDYRYVLDVCADDPETAARSAYASLRRAYPEWRILIDLPDLGQLPREPAKAS